LGDRTWGEGERGDVKNIAEDMEATDMDVTRIAVIGIIATKIKLGMAVL
jgi:hypothetical protein